MAGNKSVPGQPTHIALMVVHGCPFGQPLIFIKQSPGQSLTGSRNYYQPMSDQIFFNVKHR